MTLISPTFYIIWLWSYSFSTIAKIYFSYFLASLNSISNHVVSRVVQSLDVCLLNCMCDTRITCDKGPGNRRRRTTSFWIRISPYLGTVGVRASPKSPEEGPCRKWHREPAGISDASEAWKTRQKDKCRDRYLHALVTTRLWQCHPPDDLFFFCVSVECPRNKEGRKMFVLTPVRP